MNNLEIEQDLNDHGASIQFKVFPIFSYTTYFL